eukprot:CAMPEP_0172439616 /NCGR_PEP_ID=MMETSP1065-20121228/540_1 /TAXON_ID=265537 /ORGANISM="Amphiprora paludosa, Strain CCMP125" /LENGTH=486 /DNA_ID=CAMNT_0013188323 /DNA_START=215 /DNA_END=1675 /DNA_ORIENTATION=-
MTLEEQPPSDAADAFVVVEQTPHAENDLVGEKKELSGEMEIAPLVSDSETTMQEKSMKSNEAVKIKPPQNVRPKERASLISFTVMKESKDSKWGIALINDEENPGIVRISAMGEEGLLHKTPFQEGDVLKTVNNRACTDHEAVIQQLLDFEAGVPITIQVEAEGGNPVLVQALVKKPEPSSLLGVELINIRDEKKKNSGSMLQINKLDANGLLFYSVLSQGDWVLTINNTPCSQMVCDDAAQLILQEPDMVSILGMKPPSLDASSSGELTGAKKWLRHAKRAGIAIGGGTMVGVGLIFIPTLPPPFGEILIAGGVSVLGTEFEGPKRVVKSARDSLVRAVGREAPNTEEPSSESDEAVDSSNDDGADSPKEPKDEEESEESDDGSETDPPEISKSSSSEQSKKKTMGDRFKNFGRSVVLPFLDQVVGDQKKEEEGEKTKDGDGESDTERTESESMPEGHDEGANVEMNKDVEGNISEAPKDTVEVN